MSQEYKLQILRQFRSELGHLANEDGMIKRSSVEAYLDTLELSIEPKINDYQSTSHE